MTASKVYFTDMRCKVGTSLLEKLDRLICKAGIESIDFQNKFTAIKMHFGEPGNLSFLRPNFAKAVADIDTCRYFVFIDILTYGYNGSDAGAHIILAVQGDVSDPYAFHIGDGVVRACFHHTEHNAVVAQAFLCL